MKRATWTGGAAGWLCLVSLLFHQGRAAAQPAPTFTPVPAGPQVIVYQDEPVNVRGGPGTQYDQVGILIEGQAAAILGVTEIGSFTWFKIVYIGGPDNTGWVWKNLVGVLGDVLSAPTIIPPPTPTVRPTSTPGVLPADGSLTPSPGATRLPTFTPPAVIVHPTLLPAQGAQQSGSVPPAMIILSLFVIGILGSLASLLRRR